MYKDNTVALTLTVTGEDGPILDAAEATFEITKPDGTAMDDRTLVGGEVTNEGAGEYKTVFDVDQAGFWKAVLRITSGAGEHAATPHRFYVNSLGS